MGTNYPGGIDNFGADRTDNTNTKIPAADVNNLRHAVTAIQTELGTNPKGSKANVKTRLDDIETGGIAKKDGTLQISLNADKVDGFNASQTAQGNVAVVSGADGKIANGFFPNTFIVSGSFTDTTSSIAQNAVMTKTTPLGVSGKKFGILLCKNSQSTNYGKSVVFLMDQTQKAHATYTTTSTFHGVWDGGATTFMQRGFADGSNTTDCQYIGLQDAYISGTDLVTKWLNTGIANAKTLKVVCDYFMF